MELPTVIGFVLVHVPTVDQYWGSLVAIMRVRIEKSYTGYVNNTG